MALSEAFHTNPIEIRKQKAREVFILIRRLNEYTERKNKNINKKTGHQIERRPARDNWF